MIAFGYPDEIKEPHPKSELEYGKIIEELKLQGLTRLDVILIKVRPP